MVLKLRPTKESVTSPAQGDHSHALFLSLIERVDSELANSLHSDTKFKPFTISSLQGKFQRVKEGVKLNPNEIYQLRFTLLNDNIFASFVRSLLNLEGEIKLGLACFKSEGIALSSVDSSWAEFDSFNNIWERASNQSQISLEFLSPTTFHSGEKRKNIIFPQPDLVFGSYLNKWNSLSPIKFDESLRSYFSSIFPSRYKLKSYILDFSNHKEIGFEGVCSFEVDEQIPEEALRQINALADFAFYCGTGAKTTMGMGQTRRIG